MLLQKKVDLLDAFEDTVTWNRVGNEGLLDLSQERKLLQRACLEEELNELKEAIANSDEVECVDANCDILFVGVYMYVLDTEGTQPLQYLLVPNSTFTIDPLYSVEDLHQQLVNLFKLGLYAEMVNLIVSTAPVFAYDLEGAFKEVVRSNFTKYPKMSMGEVEEELNWFDNESKYEDVIAISSGDRVVFRCANGAGKIVKPRAFSEPQLKQFIY